MNTCSKHLGHLFQAVGHQSEWSKYSVPQGGGGLGRLRSAGGTRGDPEMTD